ncbi:MAG: four helix bundle protein [Candidatus Cryosericum sp.]
MAQLRRASLSVPTNLVEGSKRKSSADFAHFINVSEGSIAEVEYLLSFSKDLGHATKESIAPLVKEAADIGRMLYSLRTKVEHR